MKQIVAKRYAKALFQVMRPDQSREELDRTLKSLRQGSQIFKEHDDFRHIMLNSGFDRETKIRVLKALLEKIQTSGWVVKFLDYLVRKNRFSYLEEISRAFSALMDEFLGMMTVPISTAKELSHEEQEALRRGIESVTGRKVQVQWSVNPSLIGGMVVRMGEAVADGSILGQLQAVRRKLVEA